MKRRELIKKVTALLGGTMATPLMAGAMGRVLNLEPGLVADDFQEKLLAEVADIIIPATSTPGAKEAGAHNFIIRVVRDCFTKDEQKKFYDGLSRLNDDSKIKFGKGFVDLTLPQKNEMIDDATVYNKDFFREMKNLTITGYFTSEIGATQALAYDPIPGKFDGCTVLQKGQKAWAL
jgi:Gluconate 2-dehydrogenase subunit 3